MLWALCLILQLKSLSRHTHDAHHTHIHTHTRTAISLTLLSLLISAARRPVTTTLTTLLPIATLWVYHVGEDWWVHGVVLAVLVTAARVGAGYACIYMCVCVCVCVCAECCLLR